MIIKSNEAGTLNGARLFHPAIMSRYYDSHSPRFHHRLDPPEHDLWTPKLRLALAFDPSASVKLNKLRASLGLLHNFTFYGPLLFPYLPVQYIAPCLESISL
jgi:hypothetical protein